MWIIASSSRRSRATGVCSASSAWIDVLDAEEVVVHLVVEGDHLCGELAIPFLEGAHRAVDGADDALPHFLELRLDLLECGVDRHRKPAY